MPDSSMTESTLSPMQRLQAIWPDIAERAGEADATAQFPRDDFVALQQAGLLGLRIGTDWGGSAAGDEEFLAVTQLLAKASGTTGLAFNMHSSATAVVDRLATPEQKERFLRPVTQEGALFGSLTSEPGISLRNIKFGTRAVADGAGYRINGTKYFASLADQARFYLVFASDGEHPLALVIPADTPGITITRNWNGMGMRASSSHTVSFVDCWVDRRNRLPLDLDRDAHVTEVYMIGYCGVYLGIAQAAYEFALHYARNKRFNPDALPISHYPNVQDHIANLHIVFESARLLVEDAARRLARTPDPRERAWLLNRAKFVACDAAIKVTDEAFQVVGGTAMRRDLPLERYLRDARAGQVMPPNGDACRSAIAKYLLGISEATGLFGSSR